jgi:hypothetical protein
MNDFCIKIYEIPCFLVSYYPFPSIVGLFSCFSFAPTNDNVGFKLLFPIGGHKISDGEQSIKDYQ